MRRPRQYAFQRPLYHAIPNGNAGRERACIASGQRQRRHNVVQQRVHAAPQRAARSNQKLTDLCGRRGEKAQSVRELTNGAMVSPPMTFRRDVAGSRLTMSNRDENGAQAGSAAPVPVRTTAHDRRDVSDPLHQWIEQGLHDAYDAVTREPIPDGMRRLIATYQQNSADVPHPARPPVSQLHAGLAERTEK